MLIYTSSVYVSVFITVLHPWNRVIPLCQRFKTISKFDNSIEKVLYYFHSVHSKWVTHVFTLIKETQLRPVTNLSGFKSALRVYSPLEGLLRVFVAVGKGQDRLYALVIEMLRSRQTTQRGINLSKQKYRSKMFRCLTSPHQKSRNHPKRSDKRYTCIREVSHWFWIWDVILILLLYLNTGL